MNKLLNEVAVYDVDTLNTLFVYGIFLNGIRQYQYGMNNPRYATVRGFATVGDKIVTAVRDDRYTLTGLLVEVNPSQWPNIDALESGYERIVVETTSGDEAFMYAERSGNGQAEQA